jgi:hypothetical protein
VHPTSEALPVWHALRAVKHFMKRDFEFFSAPKQTESTLVPLGDDGASRWALKKTNIWE